MTADGGMSRYARHEFLIEDQVIVSGPEGELDALLAGLSEVAPQPVRALRFAELGERVTCLPGLAPDWVVALYRLVGDAPDVRKAIDQISTALTGSKKGLQVEPNYLAGLPWDVEGAPWDVEGAPWGVEGSPWGVEGSPKPGATGKGQPSKIFRTADSRWFMDQWALRVVDPDRTARAVCGAGVRVAILDTSPYYPALPEDASSVEVSTLAQADARMTLHVRHPVKRAHSRPSERLLPDVRNHGYFVAGLVHALAPGCDLHLLRVLDHDDRGDLFTMEEAFFDFLKGIVENPPANGAVVNFSLGIRVPPKEAQLELPTEVRSLYELTRAARSLGVVLVAAAGNASRGSAAPEAPEVPACFDTVLGVAACNQQGERACFSNRGDLAAPGGDGRAQGSGGDDNACRPRTADCVDGSSGWGLVGPVLLPGSADPQYTFWSGSSFASPLVSALAALAFEAGGPRPAEQIEAALRGGAQPSKDPALGAGVVQVAGTLAHC